jgi:hypothetical protein
MRQSTFRRASRLAMLAACLWCHFTLPAGAAPAPALPPACPDPASTGLPPMTWPMGLTPPGRGLPMPGYGIAVMQKFNNHNCYWGDDDDSPAEQEGDQYQFHEAIDLVEKDGLGTASGVYAAWPGVVHCVAEAGSPGTSGYAVILRHEADGGDLFTTYHHLDQETHDYWQDHLNEPVEQGRLLGQLLPGTPDVHWRHLHFVLRTSLGGGCPIGPGYQSEPITPATGFCDPFEFFARTQGKGDAVIADAAAPYFAAASESSQHLGVIAAGSVHRVLDNQFIPDTTTTAPNRCDSLQPAEDEEIFRHWQEIESPAGDVGTKAWILRAKTGAWGGDSRGGAFRGVDLVEPGSHEWYAGQPQTLFWIDGGGAQAIDLRLVSVPPGSVTVLADDLPAADEVYQFEVPAVAAGTYRVEVRNAAGGTPLDASQNLAIVPSGITVEAPAAGATWQRASSYDIRWSSEGQLGTLKIELTDEPPVYTIVSGTVDDGVHNWTVPSSLAPGPRTLRICNLAGSVCSQGVPFHIGTPTIAVTAPPSGGVCYENGPCSIAWTASGNENLKLELFEGPTLMETIASSTADDGMYSWLPVGTGTYRIKATLLSGLANAYSGYFEVQQVPYIAITNPTAGAVWRKSSPYTIAWTWGNVGGPLNIDLLSPGGSLVRRLFAATANDGQQAWTVPNDLAPGGYQLKVCKTTGTPCGSVAFSLANPTMAITQPTAGAFWQRGTTKTINWQAPGVTEGIDIELEVGGGRLQIAHGTANDGAHGWTIPSNLGGQYPLWICTASGSACANVLFNISWLQVNQPVANEVWYVGQVKTAAWSSQGLPGDLKLEILKGGIVVHAINPTPNDGSQSLTVPPLMSGANYQVRLCHLASNICGSSANFTISNQPPTITVADPQGPWQQGNTYTIGWYAPGVTEGLKIELMEGGPVHTIAASTPNDGNQEWTVPFTVEPSSYSIRICTVSLSVCDSSASFLITAPPPTIAIVAPTASSQWPRGTIQTIVWTASQYTGNVRLSLREGPIEIHAIADWTANDGFFQWPVSLTVYAGSYYVRACMISTGTCADSEYFSIVDPPPPPPPTTITVTGTGGSYWVPGTACTVSWSTDSAAGNVRVRLDKVGASTWYLLAASTPNDLQLTDCTVPPNIVAGTYRVFVQSIENPNASDYSSNITIVY